MSDALALAAPPVVSVKIAGFGKVTNLVPVARKRAAVASAPPLIKYAASCGTSVESTPSAYLKPSEPVTDAVIAVLISTCASSSRKPTGNKPNSITSPEATATSELESSTAPAALVANE